MILLSFDIEEFDMPLEYKGTIPLEEQLAISRNGVIKILDILKRHQAKATFFATVIFAQNNKDIIERLLAEGHELASHTWFHSEFKEEHLASSKAELEKLFNTKIKGIRMPRMMPVAKQAVHDAGYLYNSSINPTFLPGRYNNLNVSRTAFWDNLVLQVPASVSPLFRIPLFWLSFHNFPLGFYKFLVKRCISSTGYLNVYFHPWEFMDISIEKYKLPKFTYKNTGAKMEKRFDNFVEWLGKSNQNFETIGTFANNFKAK